MAIDKKTFILYVRNFIFGVEDSLVSTVGMLAGIASAGIMRREIIISGLVLILVEAFSMSVGSFLSERATEESAVNYHQQKSHSLAAAVVMFVSYLICGMIPLSPYLFANVEIAFVWSIVLSLVALFVFGLISAKILKTRLYKSAWRMMLVGGMAIALGVVVGIIIG